ncbi:MAG: alpha/beta fold hydrolase [Pseudomonadota bacterium]
MTTVTLNGLRTQMREWGTGPRTLLCLHPLGQEAAFFRELADGLPGWTVVSYDQRGHGAAAEQPVEAWSDLVNDAAAALKETQARHVAGFSMGGSVAADLAGRAKLAALVLSATPHRGLPVFAQRAHAVRDGGLGAIEAGTIARWFGDAADTAAIARARRSLRRMSPEGFDATWRAFATFEGYEDRTLPPTLLLAYAEDLSTPPHILDTIMAVIRAQGGTALRETIPGAGHMGLLQKPVETAATIARFLGEYG